MLAIILWATDQLHHLNPTMIAFIISSLIFLPRPIGVLEWRDAQYSLPWELFVYVGGVTTLANGLAQTKAVEVIIKMAFVSLGLKDVSYFWLLMLLIGFSIFSHFIWAATTTMTGVMAPIYIGIAQSLGFDVAKFCLPLAIMMAYALFLPFNTTGNMIFMQTGHYKPNDLLQGIHPHRVHDLGCVDHNRPYLVEVDWADVDHHGRASLSRTNYDAQRALPALALRITTRRLDDFVVSFDHDANCFGVGLVLLLQDARRQRVFVVIRQHRDSALHDDRTVVEVLVDKMDAAAADLHAVVKGLLLSFKARKCGQ